MSAEPPKKPEQHADPAKPAEKKVDKKAERAAARLAAEEEERRQKEAKLREFAHICGPLPLIESSTHKTKAFIDIKDINEDLVGKPVLIRARVHTTRKQGGKMAFLVFRQTEHTVQGIVVAKEGSIPTEMIGFAAAIAPESVVDVAATVTKVDKKTSASCCDYELAVEKLHVVSAALPVLPFQFADASRTAAEVAKAEEAAAAAAANNDDSGDKSKPKAAAATKQIATVNVDTRLACRWLDMRTPASNAIFRVQSRVGQYFRQFLLDNNFWEIHTPKLIATASEGGANVFKMEYFGTKAFLAQSPQLYKQMALQGDLERVFEIGPVFRAENSNTHRHLTEFVGLDIEMRISEHYFEVLDMGELLFNFIFDNLAKTCKAELHAVNEQYPFDPFVHKIPEDRLKALGVGIIEDGIETTDVYGGRVRNGEIRMLRLPYPKAVALLNTKLETPLAETDDINTENEKLLGRLVKARYGVDFYISDRFPLQLRPFYTMPCPDDERFSNSYDIFIRGEEISSGAQRIHDPAMLEKRAKSLNINLDLLKDYVDSFRLGAWPHGGFGVGLERVVMLYLGLKNVRYASLFPRDPQRITP